MIGEKEQKISTRPGCSCAECVAACTHKPGWLRFGDEKKIAEYMGITVKELFNKYLAVDFWTDSITNKNYFGLSPITHRATAGKMFPFDPLGTCIFFTADQKCSIHEVSPAECQEVTPCANSYAQSLAKHKEVAESWDNDQAQTLIKELLGEEPEIPEPSMADGLKLHMDILKAGLNASLRPLPLIARKFIEMGKERGITIKIIHSPARVNGQETFVYFIQAPELDKQIWQTAAYMENESPDNVEKATVWIASMLDQLVEEKAIEFKK